MSPIELWIDALEHKYWQETGRLRRMCSDPQICGYGYCPLGVLCDLFINHAPEAKEIGAHWEECNFVWTEQGKVEREGCLPPKPVLAWWHRHHSLNLMGIIKFSDEERRSFRELALYLRGAAGLTYLVGTT